MGKSYDIVIVGGGIVGLSTLHHLTEKHPNKKIALFDKESDLGRHQTGHNSGVIHSGLYYKPGSLKAKNCIEGYHMLLDFCAQHDIAYELCGKIVVATNEREIPQLERLQNIGKANGLDGIKTLDQQGILEYEPNVKGVKALHVPQTGIIDYLQVCKKMAALAKSKGATIYLGCKVIGIENRSNNVLIKTNDQTFETKQMINCGGLYSDDIAAYTEKNLDTKIIPFRGEYYMLKKEKQHLVKNLIYPVPDPNFPFLGVHFTRMIHGGVEAGPNAVLAFAKEGYKKSDFNFSELINTLKWPGFQKIVKKYWKTGLGEMYRSFSKQAFATALQQLIPTIQKEDLEQAPAGVRAQACSRAGGLLDDFKIIESSKIIHVINAPSPAATSSLSIGKSIANLETLKTN